MKKKIGTVMDERLLWEAKKAALEKKEQLSRIFEEAVSEYLEKRKKEKSKKGIVAKTQGIIRLSSDKLKEVMDEPGIYEA
jgi:metal-responsive CopG/Arc/MetJ family transcriptional regulator